MTRDDIAAVFAERETLWQTHDVEAFGRLHSEKGTVTSPMFGEVTGRDAIETSYRNLFKTFHDWDFRGESPVIDGRHAAQAFTVHMTHAAELFGVPASSRRLEIRGALFFEFDERGKISNERRIYDFTGMLIQAGVLKARPE